MSLFKTHWTPIEAEEWTSHDVWASVFSILSYFLVTVGLAGALLLQTWGFVTLAAGIVCILLMFRIIDPKLRAISEDFEKKEAQYLARLDRTTRWEVDDGR